MSSTQWSFNEEKYLDCLYVMHAILFFWFQRHFLMLLLHNYVLLHLPPTVADCHTEKAIYANLYPKIIAYFFISEMKSLNYFGVSYGWLMQVLEAWHMQSGILWTYYAMFAGMLGIK